VRSSNCLSETDVRDHFDHSIIVSPETLLSVKKICKQFEFCPLSARRATFVDTLTDRTTDHGHSDRSQTQTLLKLFAKQFSNFTDESAIVALPIPFSVSRASAASIRVKRILTGFTGYASATATCAMDSLTLRTIAHLLRL
jgi:hypothetical protein